MSQQPAYVVVDPKRGGGRFLALDGPFAYPIWVEVLEKVTPMTFMRAHDFAAAYGGVVVPFSADPIEEAKRVAARGETPKESGWVPVPWGYVG